MDLQEHLNQQLYAGIVGRVMTCRATGAVLDVRTAVVIEDADERVQAVLSPEGWARVKDAVTARVPNLRIVINGKVQE